VVSKAGVIYLEFGELMRINRLVRGRIKYEAFSEWYASLSTLKQAALIKALNDFATQAGYDDALCDQAIAEAQLDANDPQVVCARSFINDRWSMPSREFYWWLVSLPKSERLRVFKYFVYVFGLAEGVSYRACHDHGQCSHWWHGDLPTDEQLASAPSGHPFHSIAWPGSA
jgi:hypothetical protein